MKNWQLKVEGKNKELDQTLTYNIKSCTSVKLCILELPVAVPIPINEEPAFAIIARTSAKSTFTSPGI